MRSETRAMKDAEKSREQLLDELAELRRQLEVARAAFGPDEQALHPSEIMLESIVGSVPDIIYRLDIHGNIVFINEAIKTYGYDPEDLIGTNIFELVHPEDREKATY